MTTRVSLIADDSVKTGTILNGTVNSDDLNSTAGSQAVTTDTIRDGAVTFSKLQSDASNNTNRAVGTNHIQDKAVTAAKLADDTLPYLSFPLGGIVMWSGTIAQIPLGWYLCDGGTYNNIKTPDLRNRFIVGAGTNYAIDATGGSNDAVVVSHIHTGLTGTETVNHTHSYFYTDAGGDGYELEQSGSPDGKRLKGYNKMTAGVSNPHQHGFQTSDALNLSATTTIGASATNANLPPYYALAYIMKCEHRAGQAVVLTTTTPTFQELRLNGPLYDQEMDGGAQKGNPGDVLTSLGGGNGVRWSSAGSVPVGSVFHFAAATPPTGYLKANGDTVPNGVGTVQGVTANFAPLYAVLGSTYGGAGKLPDLRGEFIRGWDNARNVDTNRVFGSSQSDQMQTITGSIDSPAAFLNGSGAFSNGKTLHWNGQRPSFLAIPNSIGIPGLVAPTPANVDYTASFSSANSSGARTGTETRSRNVALLACIKY